VLAACGGARAHELRREERGAFELCAGRRRDAGASRVPDRPTSLT
jgi:hypothetical protein